MRGTLFELRAKRGNSDIVDCSERLSQRDKLPPCYHWFVSLSVPLSAHYPEGKQWSRTDIFSRGQLAISNPELRNFSVSLI